MRTTSTTQLNNDDCGEIKLIPVERADRDAHTVAKIYQKAFPESEYPEIDSLFLLCKKAGAEMLGIYAGGCPVGMMYLIKYGRCVYEIYFAIDAARRNAGIGRRAIDALRTRFSDCFIVCDVETQKYNDDAEQFRHFYLKNGCRFIPYNIIFHEKCSDVVVIHGTPDMKEFQKLIEYINAQEEVNDTYSITLMEKDLPK